MNLKRHAGRWLGLVTLSGTLIATAQVQAAGNTADELVARGNDFQKAGQLTEALQAYRQAAKTGNVAGNLAAGGLLFSQGETASGRERVLQLAEGLGYLFYAATNQQPLACARLAEAAQNGLGVQTNLVSAYAWMKIAAEGNPAFRPDLDRLAVQLDSRDIQQAQAIAHEYLSGRWPAQFAPLIEQGDDRLQIQGVSRGARGTLVIVNGQTLGVGESTDVPAASEAKNNPNARLIVSCREIGRDYLLLAVAGEPSLKMLPLQNN